MSDAEVDDLLEPAGTCCHCGQQVPERIAVTYVEVGAGPGHVRLGCLPCARSLLLRGYGHRWLADDLAVIDAARTGPPSVHHDHESAPRQGQYAILHIW